MVQNVVAEGMVTSIEHGVRFGRKISVRDGDRG